MYGSFHGQNPGQFHIFDPRQEGAAMNTQMGLHKLD